MSAPADPLPKGTAHVNGTAPSRRRRRAGASMTERERVGAALRREPTDRVPFGEFLVEDGLVRALAGLAPGAPITFATHSRVLADLGQDAVVGYPATRDGRPLHGVHLGAGQGGREPRACDPLARFGLPQPDELDWGPLRAWVEDSPFFTFAMLPGPFSELLYLLGTEDFLALTLRDPVVAARLAEGMVDYALDLARRAHELGAEGFLVGDDIAWHRGLYLSPASWRGIFLPALRREMEALRDLGVPVVLHSDGNLTEVLEDWAGLGADGLHGLQSSAGMDLASLKLRFGSRLCLWGNVDMQDIADASRHELDQVLHAIFTTGNATPGFIFGSSAGDLGVDLPAERVRETYELANRLRDLPPAPLDPPAVMPAASGGAGR